MSRHKAIIVGTGGHAQVLWGAWQAARVAGVPDLPELAGWLDVADYTGPEQIHDLPVYRETPGVLETLRAQGVNAFYLGVGMIRASRQRWQVYEQVQGYALEPLSMIHPTAIVDPTAIIGPGCFVAARAVIQPFARLGPAAIINTGAIVEHHGVLAENVHVAPGSTLCGEVQVGAHTLIGAGAVVLQQRVIGRNCTVGAGSVVLEAVPDQSTVVGNPAQVKTRVGTV